MDSRFALNLAGQIDGRQVMGCGQNYGRQNYEKKNCMGENGAKMAWAVYFDKVTSSSR
jgi:hypothetical protein